MEDICKEYNFQNAAIIKKELAFIIKLFNSIDIFINCAGIKFNNDIEKTYEENFKYAINTNLHSVFIILKELRPYFSQDASIINLSCLYCTLPMYGVISYAMSQAWLETLTCYAAAEFVNLIIRINAISACSVNTNSFRYIKVPEYKISYFKKKCKTIYL